MRITSREILNGPIGPILLRMTTPLVMGILVILFQAVDTYYVGLLGTVELAAISFTFPVYHPGEGIDSPEFRTAPVD